MKTLKKLFSCFFLSITNIFLIIYTSNINAEDSTCIKYSVSEILWRPELPHNISTIHFKIHYDVPENFYYATNTANFAEYSFQKICNEFGWIQPPPDHGRGGDDKYDIYIMQIDNRGETWYEVEQDWNYEWAPSFIIIDTDLEINILKMVVAHEFNHACQIAYTYKDGSWFYENTAVYIAEEVYDYQYEYYMRYFAQNLVNPLSHPEYNINTIIPFQLYQYSGFLWPKFLAEWLNDFNAVRKIWERMGEHIGDYTLLDIDYVLYENYETNLSTALRNYAEWRYFTGDRNDYHHFQNVDALPTATVYLTYNNLNVNNGSFDMYGPGGTRFIEFWGYEDVIDFAMNGDDSHQWKASLVEDRNPNNSVNNELILDSNGDGELSVIARGNNQIIFMPVITSSTGKQKKSGIFSATKPPLKVVRFATEIGDDNAPGTLLLDGVDEFPSPSLKPISYGNHNIKTLNERFTYFKHNNWNNLIEHHYLLKNFSVPVYGNVDQVAKYNPLKYSRIQMPLDGQIIQNKGTFEFQDPWYVLSDNSQPGNYWIPCLSSYEPNGKHGATEKGVFLNQGYDPQTQVWTPPYYSVKAISPQDIPIQHSIDPPLTLNHNFYFQNWGGENVEYQYPNQLETGVVFTNENAVATANMKGTQLSSEVNAYANSSQRKLVRTDDGWLHCVYESTDRVWYETSTDNGTTWRLMNNGKPLDNGEGKLPSLDYSSFYDPQIGETIYQIAIVFQENNTNRIRLQYFHRSEDEIDYTKYDEEIVQNLGGSYASHNANPVIGFDHGNNITIVWQHTSSGLYGRYGVINYISGITLYGSSGNQLSGTTMSSVTPTIYVSKSGTATTHLSWAQILSEEQTDIKYAKMSGSNIIGNIVTASQGSGFSKNYNLSIIEINGGARICWIGFRDISRDEYKTVFKDPEYWRFWNFDDGVKSVNINKAPNYYALAWGRGNNLPVRYTINSKLRDPKSLSIYGKDVQVCNGSSPSTVRAMVFNSNALPYYFTNSNIPLYKENDLAVGSGREGVVAKDSAQFYFAVGDIKLDGQPINFVEFDDTVSFYSAQRINELLVSEPFVLNDNSDFIYSVQYGITDSASAVSVLGSNDNINFKVELRDEQNGELLGLFDNITYTESNAVQYENIAYQVNTQGIGSRTVRLRLVVENNINPTYAITDRYAEENTLLKSTTKQISYQGSLAVKEYALYQNYPNPFNPSTVISWQSPVGSHQILKVFDVLGREVATLVNEWKEAGRYSVEFNGSSLASGVYIYQLRVNDPSTSSGHGYVATKKLMLIK